MKHVNANLPLAERFAAQTRRVDGDGCWEWQGKRDKRGYGRLTHDYREYLAHRMAWLLEHGEAPPAELSVCHRCDNPSCVRPDHLFLGTQAENMSDRDQKGRVYRGPRPASQGERAANATLTNEQVRAIKAAYVPGKYGLQTQLARQYGVRNTVVHAIVHGKAWSQV